MAQDEVNDGLDSDSPVTVWDRGGLRLFYKPYRGLLSYRFTNGSPHTNGAPGSLEERLDQANYALDLIAKELYAEREARADIVQLLVMAMERWARDTDGVPEYATTAFSRAEQFLGRPSPQRKSAFAWAKRLGLKLPSEEEQQRAIDRETGARTITAAEAREDDEIQRYGQHFKAIEDAFREGHRDGSAHGGLPDPSEDSDWEHSNAKADAERAGLSPAAPAPLGGVSRGSRMASMMDAIKRRIPPNEQVLVAMRRDWAEIDRLAKRPDLDYPALGRAVVEALGPLVWAYTDEFSKKPGWRWDLDLPDVIATAAAVIEKAVEGER